MDKDADVNKPIETSMIVGGGEKKSNEKKMENLLLGALKGKTCSIIASVPSGRTDERTINPFLITPNNSPLSHHPQ